MDFLFWDLFLLLLKQHILIIITGLLRKSHASLGLGYLLIFKERPCDIAMVKGVTGLAV
jgi:hypothetical protein